jgi:hypothetical protein
MFQPECGSVGGLRVARQITRLGLAVAGFGYVLHI